MSVNAEQTNGQKKAAKRKLSRLMCIRRGERIRTSDLLVPNEALYRAEPHPEYLCKIAIGGRLRKNE